MTTFVFYIAIVSLSAAFLLALLNKWNVIEWLQVHSPCEKLYQMFSCPFCLSWWMCVIISVTLAVVTGEGFLLFVPFCATVLTIKLW